VFPAQIAPLRPAFRVAIFDQRRRFWLGATPRVLLANPEYRRLRWFTITGDFSVRF